jgi:hypothetical protein
MAWNLQEYGTSFQQFEDLSADQYKFLIQETGTGQGWVRKPVSATEYAIGIMNNIPSAGITGAGGQIQPTVVLSGVTRLRVADAYSVGTFLMPQYDGSSTDNTGRGITAASSLKYARAVMLQASTAADDVITVRLIDQNPS